MNTAFIQIQDNSGNWIVASTTINKSTYVLTAMRQAAVLYAGHRVRAVDAGGHLIDIL
jgi:hypothetical protein